MHFIRKDHFHFFLFFAELERREKKRQDGDFVCVVRVFGEGCAVGS